MPTTASCSRPCSAVATCSSWTTAAPAPHVRSGVPWLQSYRGNRNRAIGACGRKLGNTSDLYGSAFAVDDLAAVLNKLGIGRIDLYGDSYGTFFSQTFALRHPTRLRTLILDGGYFVGGTDPWYSDTNRALRHAFTVACDRSPACARQPGRPMQRIAHLTRFLRHHPIVGRAPDADGLVRRVRVDVNRLIDIVNAAAHDTDRLSRAGRRDPGRPRSTALRAAAATPCA